MLQKCPHCFELMAEERKVEWNIQDIHLLVHGECAKCGPVKWEFNTKEDIMRFFNSAIPDMKVQD